MDLKGFNSKTVSGGFMSVMNAISTVDEANYYECFHRVYIINAPMFFRVFFKSVSALLREDTRKKFIMLEDMKALEKYIDRSNIPQRFGGDVDDKLALCSATNVSTVYLREFDATVKRLAANASAPSSPRNLNDSREEHKAKQLVPPVLKRERSSSF